MMGNLYRTEAEKRYSRGCYRSGMGCILKRGRWGKNQARSGIARFAADQD